MEFRVSSWKQNFWLSLKISIKQKEDVNTVLHFLHDSKKKKGNFPTQTQQYQLSQGPGNGLFANPLVKNYFESTLKSSYGTQQK